METVRQTKVNLHTMLRYHEPLKAMTDTRELGHTVPRDRSRREEGGITDALLHAPGPRSREDAYPVNKPNVEQDNPDRVSAMSKPTVRKAEISSGCRKTQEAKAGSRKTRGNHNPPDRVIPKAKAC